MAKTKVEGQYIRTIDQELMLSAFWTLCLRSPIVDTRNCTQKNLKSSKTDQRLKSVTLIIRRQVDKLICPIESLKRYLSIRSNFPDGNLFIHFDGSNLTRYQFSYILQKSLNFCEEKGLYKPHSFRIGGATEAKRLGFDDDTIMQWGRWSSNAYEKYIRLDL